MSIYGIEAHICGVPCAMVLRSAVNGQYQAVFERGTRKLEDVPEALRDAVSRLGTGEAE